MYINERIEGKMEKIRERMKERVKGRTVLIGSDFNART